MYVDHPNGQLTNRRGTFCPLMQYTKFSKKLEDVVTFSRVGHVYYPEKFEHVVQALHNGWSSLHELCLTRDFDTSADSTHLALHQQNWRIRRQLATLYLQRLSYLQTNYILPYAVRLFNCMCQLVKN